MPRAKKVEGEPLKFRVVVKDEEKRMFIIFDDRPTFNMEDLAANREYRDRETSAALAAKADFEYANGVKLLNFHLDPNAGGQVPITEKGYIKIWKNPEPPHEETGRSMVYPMRAIPAWTGEWL